MKPLPRGLPPGSSNLRSGLRLHLRKRRQLQLPLLPWRPRLPPRPARAWRHRALPSAFPAGMASSDVAQPPPTHPWVQWETGVSTLRGRQSRRGVLREGHCGARVNGPFVVTGGKAKNLEKTLQPLAVRATALIKVISKSSPILDIVFAYGHFDCEI